MPPVPSRHSVSLMPPVPSCHSVSLMPLRRSARIAAKAPSNFMPVAPSRHSVSLMPVAPSRHSVSLMPVAPSCHSVSLMPLRRSPRLAMQQKAAPKPVHRTGMLSSVLESAKAKARADIEARIKARVEQMRGSHSAAQSLSLSQLHAVNGSKMYFVNTIRTYLELIMTERGSDVRIAHSTLLMNFVHTEAISFVKEHPRFQSCIINKCYDLKRAVHLLGKDAPAFTEACNKVLVALGQPLEQTLRPETMTKHELTVLIQQLKNYRERASRDI